MKTYRVSAAKFAYTRRRALRRGLVASLVLAVIAGASGVLVEYFRQTGEPATAVSYAIAFLFLFSTFFLVFQTGISFRMARLSRAWAEYELILGVDRIMCTRAGKETITVRREEIVGLREDSRRGLWVEAGGAHSAILIPYELEGYGEVRGQLVEWREAALQRTSMREDY